MNIAEFRSGLREWFAHNDLSPGPDHSLDGQVAQLARVRRALYDAGWMRYGWPVEVGGLGGPAVLRAVLGEEVASRDLAEPGIYSMIEVLAPTMISYAPPALAAEMVPLLLSGAEQWCQGFSEPGSGSDLASLSTRAEQREDGSWLVNGQKVWTSLAQYSQRCVLLTRTAPGHGGITAFFVDMDTPGITVRPLRTMHGIDEFAEVFFDDVVVPADRMLGEPGDGWQLAMDLLPHERSTCFWHRVAFLYERLERLIDERAGLDKAPATVGTAAAAGATVNAGATANAGADDADLGGAYLALHTIRCRSHATQRRLAAGAHLGPETSIDKVLLATAEQRLFDTARDLLPGAVELTDPRWRSEYLYSRAATIYGGTAEIQRNIIARRLLELGKE
ncbi:acyl-CoA dehydrogenase [Frankia sp. EI5c]|uniref:acyl-CoA dehydrogenase family protein n=1 Tax=Frankia sp. EI5c TaxID=683316 RepID=UPI0007C300CF|nr:acyl-CoA dehydrogenase family protein [Frankia sp. EI5c]OAA29667.1 acyl-CoA dehydrogenase [Frankia sp. EI5c]